MNGVSAAVIAGDAQRLAKYFDAMQPKELHDQLSLLFREIPHDQVDKKLQLCAEVLSPEKLEAACAKEALATANELFGDAKYYLATTTSNAPPKLQALITALIDTQIAIVDSFISAFGISSFFKQAENSMMGEFKLHRLTTLISTVSLLSGAVLPLIGEAVAGYIVGGVCLVLAALSLLYPYIMPIPSTLPSQGENITKQLVDGKLKAVTVRTSYLDAIANILSRKGRPHHAMLIGDYGVGKSETAIAFAQALIDSKYPDLAGMTVFYFNASHLATKENAWVSMSKLAEIVEALGRHRKYSILVIDEIQALCNKSNADIGKQLLTYLDNKGDAGFRRVIGITTREQINDLEAANYGLSDRFEKIVIESATCEETVAILNADFLRNSVKPLLAVGAIAEIFRKTYQALPSQAQPKVSLKILSNCRMRTSREQKLPIEAKIDAIRSRVLAAATEKTVAYLTEGVITKDGAISKLEKELKALEQKLDAQRSELAAFYETKELFEKVTSSLFATALKVASQSDSRLKSKLLLLEQFSQVYLKPHIRELSEKLAASGIKTCIDAAVIDEEIASETKRVKAQAEAQKEGRKQRKGRAL